MARLGSVAAAARELGLNPPYISKSVKRVEVAAKRQFFQRAKTGVSLTPDGRKFLDFARKISDTVNAFELDEAGETEHVRKKLLTVMGTSYLMKFLISQGVAEIKKSEANYRFRIYEAAENLLVNHALHGLVDVAIHTRKLDWPKSWVTTSIGYVSWVLCARHGHPLGKVTNEVDLNRYPFVMPVGLHQNEFRRGDDHCPMPANARVPGEEVLTADVGLQVVAKTEQLIYVPEIMVREHIEAKTLQVVKVKQWGIVREPLLLSAQADVSQLVYEKLIRACELR